MDKRTFRVHSFKLLFQVEFREMEPVEESVQVYAEENKLSEKDVTELTARLCDVMAKQKELDQQIEKYSKGWALERIGKAELAILRLAIYELLFDDETPDAVVINEAVELAKSYTDEKAPAFINGVLGQVTRNK